MSRYLELLRELNEKRAKDADISIRVETRDVTPEMARHWLTKNKRNRLMNQKRVNLYAEEMRNGNWLDHHQGIAFYADGSLADGQHRLAAVQQSGVTVRMIVAWNVPEESGLMIDGHQQRQIHQSIRISGLADWIGKNEVAVARMMMQIQSKSVRCIATSHTDLIRYCERHREAISFAIFSLDNHRKNITTAGVKASVACAYYFEDSDRISNFCDVIVSGMPTSEADKAAILLREWLIEVQPFSAGGVTRVEHCKRVMRAIKAFCEKQSLNRLYKPTDFIYLPPHGE